MLKAEPRTLAARNDEDRDFAGSQRLRADGLRVGIRLIRQHMWQRRDSLNSRHRVRDIPVGKKLGQQFEIKATKFINQCRAFSRVEQAPPCQRMGLTVAFQQRNKIIGRLRHRGNVMIAAIEGRRVRPLGTRSRIA